MFDGDTNTYWHSDTAISPTSSITVTFLTEVRLFGVKITAKPYAGNQARYQNICSFVDGSKDVCTASDRTTKDGEVIGLKLSEPMVESEIMIQFNNNQYAEVAELEVIYESKSNDDLKSINPNFN